eukprot:gene6237-10243_t
MQDDSLSSKIDIRVKCKDLVKLDTFSPSDPQCILYCKDPKKGKWYEIGRTEFIQNEPNPVFSKTFQMQFRFEETQELKFLILDIDNSSSNNIEDQDTIGELYCTVAEIVGSKASTLTKPLKNSKHPNRKNGFISINAESQHDSKHLISFNLSASKLTKKNFFGKSDPYIIIYRQNNDGSHTIVYKSNHILANLNPTFPKFELPSGNLCLNDYDRTIRIEIWDYSSWRADSLIGRVETTINKMNKNHTHKLTIVEKGKTHDSGTLLIDKMVMTPCYTFLDYISGGHQVSLLVAIDFTASNGKINQSNSLHALSQNKYNDYQKAIISVGNILNYYDSDKKYPVYGFGAKLPDGKLSHCFPCTLDFNNIEVYGVEGILTAYNNAVQKVQFFGPTYFRYVIQSAAYFANRDKGTNYYILLILTDGEITDMSETIDEIVKASNLPLSIIIVGIGNEKFQNMVVLDADDVPLVSNGVKMARDIVQFVPFKDFKDLPLDRLAQEVLEEVPGQFVEYMKKNNITPNQVQQNQNPFSTVQNPWGKIQQNVQPNIVLNQQPQKQSSTGGWGQVQTNVQNPYVQQNQQPNYFDQQPSFYNQSSNNQQQNYNPYQQQQQQQQNQGSFGQQNQQPSFYQQPNQNQQSYYNQSNNQNQGSLGQQNQQPSFYQQPNQNQSNPYLQNTNPYLNTDTTKSGTNSNNPYLQ